MGRKPEGRRPMTRTLTLSCGEQMWRRVKAVARRRGDSMSRVVRGMVYTEIQRLRELLVGGGR